MKVCSIPICQDTFISKKNEHKNYSNNEKLYIGKCNEEEYRTIIKFNIPKNKIDGKIKKVELSLYLMDLNMTENTKCFMLNISRNIEPVDYKEVSYSDAPKFCQQCENYKIKKCFKRNYLKLDITKIARSWIKDGCDNFGITLIGLYEDSFITLFSSRGRKKSHVNIYIEECPKVCTPPVIDETVCTEGYDEFMNKICNNQNDYEKNLEHKYNYDESYINNYIKDSRDDFDREEVERIIEEKIQKEMEKEIESKKIIKEDSKIEIKEKEIAYGYFYNDNGNLLKQDRGTTVIFNGCSNVKNMKLNEMRTGILIKKAGVYKIDYGVNGRCDSIDIMQLEINGQLIPHTNIQVGLCESMIWGKVILSIDEDNTEVKLRLLSMKTLLMIIGVAAAINIVKID